METNTVKRRKLLVYTGAMFSGKTDNLMAEAGQYIWKPNGDEGVVWFRPDLDTRQEDPELIGSLRGITIPKELLKATIFHNSQELWEKAQGYRVILVDEGQFGDDNLPDVLHTLYLQNKRVVFGGLDMTWQGIPFPTTSKVISLPETKIFRLRHRCSICGDEKGTRSQLLGEDGKAIPITQPMPEVNIGGRERFQTVCDRCWILTTPGAKERLRTSLPWLSDQEFDDFLVRIERGDDEVGRLKDELERSQVVIEGLKESLAEARRGDGGGGPSLL